jgi:hypothetical protein
LINAIKNSPGFKIKEGKEYFECPSEEAIHKIFLQIISEIKDDECRIKWVLCIRHIKRMELIKAAASDEIKHNEKCKKWMLLIRHVERMGLIKAAQALKDAKPPGSA